MDMISTGSECTLVACPNPLDRASKIFARVPAGQTLAEMVGAGASYSLGIAIDGHEVPCELWAHTRPKAGRTIHVTSYPQGGNGGKYLRMAAMIALMYFSAGWSSTLTGEFGVFAGASPTLVQAGIMMAGSLALTPMIGQAREIAA